MLVRKSRNKCRRRPRLSQLLEGLESRILLDGQHFYQWTDAQKDGNMFNAGNYDVMVNGLRQGVAQIAPINTPTDTYFLTFPSLQGGAYTVKVDQNGKTIDQINLENGAQVTLDSQGNTLTLKNNLLVMDSALTLGNSVNNQLGQLNLNGGMAVENLNLDCSLTISGNVKLNDQTANDVVLFSVSDGKAGNIVVKSGGQLECNEFDAECIDTTSTATVDVQAGSSFVVHKDSEFYGGRGGSVALLVHGQGASCKLGSNGVALGNTKLGVGNFPNVAITVSQGATMETWNAQVNAQWPGRLLPTGGTLLDPEKPMSVKLTIDSGGVWTNHGTFVLDGSQLFSHTQSGPSLDIKGANSSFVTDDLIIGDTVGSGWAAALVEDGGSFTANDDVTVGAVGRLSGFTVMAGSNALIDGTLNVGTGVGGQGSVSVGGIMDVVGDLYIGTGVTGQGSVDVSGTLSVRYIFLGHDNVASGALQIKDGGVVDAYSLYGVGDLSLMNLANINTSVLDVFNFSLSGGEISLQDAVRVTAVNASISGTMWQFRSGRFETTGDDPLYIQGGNFVIFDADATLIGAGGIFKGNGADINGGGKMVAPPGHAITTGGLDADLLPGDYFDGRDDSGNLIVNSSPTDAFGTLTIDGNLDASAGFTLDSVLGSSGASSLLYVTGTATLGGNLAAPSDGTSDFGQLHLFTTANPTGIPLSATYTLLTADGGFNSTFIQSGFTDYPWIGTLTGTATRYTSPIPGGVLGLPDSTWWTLSCDGTHLQINGTTTPNILIVDNGQHLTLHVPNGTHFFAVKVLNGSSLILDTDPTDAAASGTVTMFLGKITVDSGSILTIQNSNEGSFQPMANELTIINNSTTVVTGGVSLIVSATYGSTAQNDTNNTGTGLVTLGSATVVFDPETHGAYFAWGSSQLNVTNGAQVTMDNLQIESYSALKVDASAMTVTYAASVGQYVYCSGITGPEYGPAALTLQSGSMFTVNDLVVSGASSVSVIASSVYVSDACCFYDSSTLQLLSNVQPPAFWGGSMTLGGFAPSSANPGYFNGAVTIAGDGIIGATTITAAPGANINLMPGIVAATMQPVANPLNFDAGVGGLEHCDGLIFSGGRALYWYEYGPVAPGFGDDGFDIDFSQANSVTFYTVAFMNGDPPYDYVDGDTFILNNAISNSIVCLDTCVNFNAPVMTYAVVQNAGDTILANALFPDDTWLPLLVSTYANQVSLTSVPTTVKGDSAQGNGSQLLGDYWPTAEWLDSWSTLTLNDTTDGGGDWWAPLYIMN